MDSRSARVRLIVEIEGSADVPRGRVGDGEGEYVDFLGWSSMAAAIERWRSVGTPTTAVSDPVAR